MYRFRSKSQSFKALKGSKRLPGGRQALLGDVDGWNMIVGFAHDAVVFRNNSQSFLRLVRFAPQSVSKPDRRYGGSEMTLIDRTELQTSEDVIFQGGGWIIKGFFGWALVLSAVGVWGPFAPVSDTFTLVIKLSASTLLLIVGSGLLFACKD